MHLNIRSITKNFDALYEFIFCLSFILDLVCLTEVRIEDQPLANIKIPGYSFVHINWQSYAGCVAIYISKNLTFRLCENTHHWHTFVGNLVKHI